MADAQDNQVELVLPASSEGQVVVQAEVQSNQAHEAQENYGDAQAKPKRGAPSLVLRTIATTVAKFLKRPSKSMTKKWSGIVQASKMSPKELLEACAVGLHGFHSKLEQDAEPYPFEKGTAIDRERLLILIRITKTSQGKHALALRFCQM